MPPDFNKKTIDLLARRAGGHCSNPDCRILTIGPNSNPEKHTTLGEAAHIAGARPDSARYNPTMTDTNRAMTSNAIWLCRNCHKMVDGDASQFPSDILFIWRAEHERFVTQELGTKGQAIQYEIQKRELGQFAAYPLHIQRIVEDRPDGWELHLTAELMRHLNGPHFKRLEQLRLGLVSTGQSRIEVDEVFGWIASRSQTMRRLIPPLVKCIGLLNRYWGKPGEVGDLEGILEICLLIEENLVGIVKHEEEVRFANLPEEADEVLQLLTNALGYAVRNIAQIPDKLDNVIELALGRESDEEPLVVKDEIVFDLPDGWGAKMERAIEKLECDLRLQDF